MRQVGSSRRVIPPLARPKVVASVLTRNRRDLLRRAIAGVIEQTRAVDEVIVVDNQSSDGTLEMLADDFPEVHVVALAENRGATGGFYEAIKAAHMAGADWVWLLDDDSIVWKFEFAIAPNRYSAVRRQ